MAVDKIMTLAKYQDAEKDKDTSDDYNSDSEEVLYFLYKKHYSVKLSIFSYPYFLVYVLGAQKNCLNETVLLSTHNICFG